MVTSHLVRVGQLGQIGRFSSPTGIQYPRHSRVICRTARGLELGEVLSTSKTGSDGERDGQIVRGVTLEDDLMRERLERHKQRAFDACRRELLSRGMDAVLVDAELLFDGRSLYFYFMGPVSEQVEQLTNDLAELYEARARIKDFSRLLTKGCGPNCGEADAAGGCDSGGCSGCAVSGCRR